MKKINELFNVQLHNYKQYKTKLLYESTKNLIIVNAFNSIVFFSYFLLNSYYEIESRGIIYQQTYLNLIYAILFFVAIFITRYLTKHEHLIMIWAHINAAIIFSFLIVSYFSEGYFISLGIMIVVIFSPMLCIYSPYFIIELLLFITLLIEFFIRLTSEGLVSNSFDIVYYALESLLIFTMALIVERLAYNNQINRIIKINRLKSQRDIDGLTGLFNRLAAEKYIKRYSHITGEHGLILIDLDKFKEINDTYGHLKGDEFLVAFSDILSHHFRKNDCIARYGGDEFLIFVPFITPEELKTKVDNFKHDISYHELDGIPLHYSIGFSTYNCLPNIDNNLFKNLFRQADEKMYSNKHSKKTEMANN